MLKKIKIREYGLSHWIFHENKDICEKLQKHFNWFWKEILTGVYNRIGYCAPIKRYQFHYENSYLKEIIGCSINRNTFSKGLEKLGLQRGEISEYMKSFIDNKENSYALIDMTSIINQSKDIGINHIGYNGEKSYKPQVNVVFIYDENKKEPVYYLIEPGNKRDVLSLKRVIEESQLKNAIIIVDKGFKSNENVELLEKYKLNYIMVLKRNDSLIDYNMLNEQVQNSSLNYFIYKKRPIWYYSKVVGNRRLIIYLDEFLRSSEIQDYLLRVDREKEGYTRENFIKKKSSMGTLAILTTEMNFSEEKIYQLYKIRCDIEQMYDIYHGYFKIDKSFIRNQYQLEEWLFINFIAMKLYYRLYQKLLEKGLLKDYSVEDIITFLKEVKIYHTTKSWNIENFQKKYLDLFNKLDICIT